MKYDFDTLVNRQNSGNMKYRDTPEEVLQAGGISYSGAEMDFKTAPVIMEALAAKARNGLYGYTITDDEYINAMMHWMKTRRDFEIQREWIVPTYGTLQAMAAAIRAFSSEGEGVVIQPPVYLLYRKVIEHNHRQVVESPLLYEGGEYRMDFTSLEQVFARRDTKLMVLCNPHNPIGKVWPRDVLTRVAELAARYDVLVIIDEIFAEVVFNGHYTVPYLQIPGAEGHAIVTTSLGKVFNFTGFSHANVLIASESLRASFLRQREIDHYGSINPFMREALIAGYRHGGEWVDEMLGYVQENIRLVCDFFQKYLPQITIPETQGTFLIWMDWNALGLSEEELHAFLRKEAALDLDCGSWFGTGGYGFTRMNLATPRKPLEQALERLKAASEQRGYTTMIKGVRQG